MLDLLMGTRILQTTPNKDGSATTHVLVKCTLYDLAKATGLRVEDVAFTLAECGLLRRRLTKKTPPKVEPGTTAQARRDDEEFIVVSRQMVEAVAEVRNVKKMCLDLKHVLL